jgi:hypothetical protein
MTGVGESKRRYACSTSLPGIIPASLQILQAGTECAMSVPVFNLVNEDSHAVNNLANALPV